ncbi:alanine/glycine:cation symporter family protein [Kordiimonas pumila]|uniref:Alanine/glycine:cation symporter family protein n=1 Tax=Kordiimonas pumila TaxID=2161677 RepID=A0ABV7D7X3_9PROT|nr:alanine/glycine:cation symporter family protein [Kordiimonas pumila]
MSSFKRLVASLGIWALFAMPALADEGLESRGGFVDFIVAVINGFGNFVFSKINLFGVHIEWIVAFLALPMILLTVYFKFINLTSFKRALNIVRGRYNDDTAPGEVTQFQALSTALSGTVGLGNIAGVAVAISIGGPGATFWMILIGFCAMSLKFAECTLGVKYRIIHPDGTVSGGPMYYLEQGLKNKGMGKLGKILAWSYAIIAIPTMAQIAQVNQSYEAVAAVTGFDSDFSKWSFGLVVTFLTVIVIFGGLKSIAKVTARLVPAMAAIYIGAALVIILGHFSHIPDAFITIFSNAFTSDAGMGGVVGSLVIAMQRAVYSTEAGIGSATIAHSAAKTHEPVSEGMVALMEPFIDTVIVCTMTALVIVITGTYTASEGATGISMTAAAFGSVISWFPWVLALAAFLFAYSTIISWSYYSSRSWEFLFGGSKRSMTIFKVVFCLFLIPGPLLTVGEVYLVMDSLFFMLAVPNIIGIYIMAPEIKRDLKSYLSRLKSGEIKMVK